MHDPSVLVCDIPAPWLERGLPAVLKDGTRLGPDWGLSRHRRTNAANYGQPTWPWWRPRGYRLFLAGREYRAATLAMLWHEEPGGADALTVCRGTRWRWHVRHWRLTPTTWRHLQRRLFTRCDYCRGRSGKRADAVNCSVGWYSSERRRRWWSSESGLFHQECLGADRAWKSCVCPRPNPPQRITMAWYRCGDCGGTRWVEQSEAARAALLLYRRPPRGTRPPAELVEQIRGLFDAERGEVAVDA